MLSSSAKCKIPAMSVPEARTAITIVAARLTYPIGRYPVPDVIARSSTCLAINCGEHAGKRRPAPVGRRALWEFF